MSAAAVAERHQLKRVGRDYRGQCPGCGARTALAVRDGRSRVLIRCYAGCEFRELAELLGLPREERPQDHADSAAEAILDAHRAKTRQELAARLWAAAGPLQGTPAESYLRGRGCPLPPADGDLRYMPHVDVFGLSGPALIGRITKFEDARAAIGAHVTMLQQDGDRWHRAERRIVGLKAGGVVRLWPDEAVTHAVGVGEGIETGLALAALAGVPAWAAIDAGNLARLPVLPAIEALHVGADRDQSGTGQRAAAALAERWLAAGREVRIVAADELGRDIADEVQEATACAA